MTLLRIATRVYFQAPDELADLLATVSAGAGGSGKARWRLAIGPIECLPTWRYVRTNWFVHPRGSDDEREVVEQVAEIVRAEHPYIGSQRERSKREHG